ncbi:YD repeat-containing protein [Ferrimonas balearica DSM 9799]|uniref:YD repeat-containing protein n=2 Tax=Ferrimonas balearica TaxID=44012 RepID=E1SNJ8_FERBD|nr:YD repeat-containing protein [Ferrimonas balearica DSM 9799]
MDLIHMNGRVYDYNLGRFMSVDPYIQAPTSTQSINPYSYVMNNPLAGTDPTGYTSVGIAGGAESRCLAEGSCENGGPSTEDSSDSSNEANNGHDSGMQSSTGEAADIGSQSSRSQNSESQNGGHENEDPIERIQVTCDRQCQEDAQNDHSFAQSGLGVGSLVLVAFSDGPQPGPMDAVALLVGLGLLSLPGDTSSPGNDLSNMRGASESSGRDPNEEDPEDDGRPEGVPKDWIKKPSRNGKDVKWVDPRNPHSYVRVKRNGEVTQVRNGRALDKDGNEVRMNSPEAHGIQLKDFKFRR